jgi:hypothetical protein
MLSAGTVAAPGQNREWRGRCCSDAASHVVGWRAGRGIARRAGDGEFGWWAPRAESVQCWAGPNTASKNNPINPKLFQLFK